jgi:5-formyltetrahydrofolate cyclo-ligase
VEALRLPVPAADCSVTVTGKLRFRASRFMEIAIQKQALRRATVERILSLDPARRAEEESALVARLPTLPGFETAGCVLMYASAFPEEIATAPLLRQALGLGKQLVLPRVDRAEKRLRLHVVHDLAADLRQGMLGIPEPRRSCPEVEPDRIAWVLVPGLAFDDRCYRLGRGAGYYDRLLPTLRPDTPRWALILDEQWIDRVPVEPHDVPVDGLASPGRTQVSTRMCEG